jgi:signal transduction histidine kinase/CheY-like chemotaxis protein
MMHNTLKRQLHKLGLDQEKMPNTPEQWEKIIATISACYTQYDEDRYLLERSLDISSTEMQKEFQQNKAMSLQLAQAGKMASLGTLASGIAHELNNPLAIVIGYVELLQLSASLNSKEKVTLEKIISVSKRMASTIKHLLKLSRQGDGDINTLLQLQKPIHESLELLRSQFQKDNIQIQLDFPEENLFILGNENALSGVFQNLFTNSRDAFLSKKNANSQPTINIRVIKKEQNINVIYTDNAGGISNEVINKIFDPFFTTKDVGFGTGIGLSISKQVIESHKGQIHVSSIENVGTTFEIIFPLASPDMQKSSELTNAEIHQNDSLKLKPIAKKALIVDDETEICDYLQTVLSDNFTVTATSSPQSALNLIRDKKFDLVITDLRMPLISGQQIAAELRTYQPQASLIFMSGHIDNNSNGSLDSFKPFLLIEKPFPEMLLFKNLIANYCDSP